MEGHAPGAESWLAAMSVLRTSLLTNNEIALGSSGTWKFVFPVQTLRNFFAIFAVKGFLPKPQQRKLVADDGTHALTFFAD